MGYRIGVDVGGTFTDIVSFDEATKRLEITKVPSTPRDQSQGVIDGITKIVRERGLQYQDISSFVHGTTVATNTLLERNGAKAALITTEGFRDVFEIGRQTRPDLYDFWAKRPKPPIPRYLVFEVPERVLFDGKVEKQLDDNKARQIAKELKKAGVDSIAVCFLHSYINPVNEKRMREIIAEEIPDVYTSISYEILPEIKEYERVCTTSVNAYLMQKVQAYIDNLVKRKDSLGIKPKLQVMQSNGGIMSADVAARRSIHTVFSGPAGGALAGLHISKLIGEDDVITLDMGGTSTDLVLIEKGQLKLTTDEEIGGFPIKVPSIEIHTLGAGGGSIAWVDDGGTLRVGPQSAGADPGPACYDLGGAEPTVTDASLVLGRLSAENFLGGEKSLSAKQADLAIEKRVSRNVNLSVTDAAMGIIRVVNSNICGGVNVISTEKGYDLREFTLVAFGGAGPLFAAEIANELKMKRVVIPPFPGNFCAVGEAVANVRYDYVCTNVKAVDDITIDEYNELYEGMKQEAVSQLTEEGYRQDDIVFRGNADMRYARQFWELSIPVPYKLSTKEDLDKMVRGFNDIHKKTYGYSLEDESVVFVNFRLSAEIMRPPLELEKEPLGNDTSQQALKSSRGVYFGDQITECPVYDRNKLVPGSQVTGPAIIEEYASTTLVPAENTARIDTFRNIIIEVA